MLNFKSSRAQKLRRITLLHGELVVFCFHYPKFKKYPRVKIRPLPYLSPFFYLSKYMTRNMAQRNKTYYTEARNSVLIFCSAASYNKRNEKHREINKVG